jgi:hypothetical protein
MFLNLQIPGHISQYFAQRTDLYGLMVRDGYGMLVLHVLAG